MEKKQVKAKFGLIGRNAIVEFENYVPLNFVGKKLLPHKVKEEIRQVTGFSATPIFGRLSDFGLKADKFFTITVEVPSSWLRKRQGFRLADLAS